MVAAKLALHSALIAVLATAGAGKKDCRRLGNYWARSEKTCEELIDENIPGIEMVDGTDYCQTAQPDGACRNRVTYDTARDACSAVGMRLCRPDEPGEVDSCSISSRTSWYSSPCAANSFVVGSFDGTDGLNNVACHTWDRSNFHVLCCADSEDSYRTGRECRECPENSYRNDAGRGMWEAACTCFSGYVPVYDTTAERKGLLRCERSTSTELTKCPADQFASRTAGRCDGATGLVATRGYVDKGSVCVASKGAMDGTSCPPDKLNSINDAMAYCAASGARLCTMKEFEQGIAEGTDTDDCRVEGKLIPTSTNCDAKGSRGLVYERNRKGGASFSCRSKSKADKMSVLCCADTGTAAQCLSCPDRSSAPSGSNEESDCVCLNGRGGGANICSETQRPTAAPTLLPDCAANQYKLVPTSTLATRKDAARVGDKRVWGWSPKENGDCPDARNNAQAVAFCASKQARLCTADELLRAETRGTGCGMDQLYVWSSTPCCDAQGTCTSNKFYVAAGKGRNGRFGPGEKLVCSAASAKFKVRCCRDALDKAICKRCPANAVSAVGSDSVTDCKCPTGFWGRDGGPCEPV